MRIKCLNCNHVCHCIGQGYFLNVNTCPACSCIECIHEFIIRPKKEELMIKKFLAWVWKIVSWPFKKIAEWLWTK